MSIALTFDDGPSEWTEPILDLLAEHDAHATFFVVGRNVKGREAVLRRMLAEGHEVGNHTFTHPRMTKLSDENIRRELTRTQQAIFDATGRLATLWRAPHFDIDERVHKIGLEFSLTHVGATIDPSDWKASRTQILQKIRGAATGSIVDLHDGVMGGTPSRQPTVDALNEVLPTLPGPFVTIPELQCVLAA